MRFRKQEISLGDAADREYQRFEVREENVRALITALATALATVPTTAPAPAERRPVGAPAD